MSYIDLMKEKARSDKKTIVLPETNDKRTLIAAASILKEEIADIIMIGNEEKIMDGAGWLEVELDGVTIIDPEKSEKLDGYVNILYETRKNKGMTPEKAREILLSDYLTFGVVMVKANDADGMVAGACHATADTLRPALQILKTAPGVKLVSGFFILDVPDCTFGEKGTFLFADCGLNQDPTAEELAAIAAEHVGRAVVFDLPDETEKRGYSTASKALLDGKKLRALGWRAGYDIDTGLRETIDILRELGKGDEP